MQVRKRRPQEEVLRFRRIGAGVAREDPASPRSRCRADDFRLIGYAIKRDMRGGAADGCADEVVMADGKGASAGAQMAIEMPDSALWRLGRVAVVSGLAVSLIIHLALVGTAVLVSARFGHPSPVQAVTVDLVTSDDLAAAEPPKPDHPAPSKAPEPETQAQPPAPAPFAPPSAPPPSSPPPSAPAPSADTYAPPAAPPRPPPPPAPPRGQAAELAQLLGLPTPSADFAGGGT